MQSLQGSAFSLKSDQMGKICSTWGSWQDNQRDEDFLPWPLLLCEEPWPGRRPCLAFHLLLLRHCLTSRASLWALGNTHTDVKDFGKLYTDQSWFNERGVNHHRLNCSWLSPPPAVNQLSSHRCLRIQTHLSVIAPECHSEKHEGSHTFRRAQRLRTGVQLAATHMTVTLLQVGFLR